METTQPMHRISAVRRQQGVSLREVARRMRKSRRKLICQEAKTSDLTLSELWAWQSALGVPIGKLLIDRAGPLNVPKIDRSTIDRLAGIATNILDDAPTTNVKRLATAMVLQLREIIPEEDR